MPPGAYMKIKRGLSQNIVEQIEANTVSTSAQGRLGRYIMRTRTPVLQVATELEVTPATVYALITGASAPREEMVGKILRYLALRK